VGGHIHIGFGGVWDYRAVEENWEEKNIKIGGGGGGDEMMGNGRWTADGAVLRWRG